MSRLIFYMVFWLAAAVLPTTAVAGKNVAPAVSLTAPLNNASFTAPATITLSASATDADGSIAKVEFYRSGTILIGTATAIPYAVTWSNAPAGNYSLTAKATDSGGASTTSTAVSITVTAPPPNAPPTVILTTPTNGANFTEPATIDLSASAGDPDGTIAKVNFYQGTTLIGTATGTPYTYTWSNVPAANYTLRAIATDNLGASAISEPVVITVNRPPLVALTAPANCGTFDTSTGLDLNANSIDPDGHVVRVDYYADDVLVGSVDNPSSYLEAGNAYWFHWAGMSAGTYTLTARAIDNRGAVATSEPVILTIAPANQPPSVYLTAPANGAVFGTTEPIAVSAEAQDSDGSIAKVEFYRGTTLIGTDTAPPYSVIWSGTKSAGQYALLARATDNRGAMTVSAVVSITISANAPPAVSLTSPSNGSSFTAPATINLAANAADSDGSIAQVEFFSGSTRLATVTTAPYAYTWSDVPTGSYSLTAKATDNLGATATSAAASITVAAQHPAHGEPHQSRGERQLPGTGHDHPQCQHRRC